MTAGATAGGWELREARADDAARLLEINQAATPGVNSLTLAELDALVEQAALTLVACDAGGVAAGFVLCMVEGMDYRSLNYRWLSERYDRFAYVDRVAVSPAVRGRGLGGVLYAGAADHFRSRRPILLAEVNLAPPNPGSVRFHERGGFVRVGERWSDDGQKGVVYLAKDLG